MADFLLRLKQRKLVQWAFGCVTLSLALIPVQDTTASRFDWSQTTVRCRIITPATGFFVTSIAAWCHGAE